MTSPSLDTLKAALTARFKRPQKASDKPRLPQLPVTISAPDGDIYEVDLCESGHLRMLQVELTSKCNLRCVYCPKSDEVNERMPGRNMDMPINLVHKLVAISAELTPDVVEVSGTGETTTLPDWMERSKAFKIGAPTRLSINTNFARVMSDEEIGCLLDFDFLNLSIDTADAQLLREVRSKVNLQTIVYNIARLHAAAIRRGRSVPKLWVRCVVTNRIVGQLLDLAALLVALNVKYLELLDLFESPRSHEAGLRSVLRSNEQELISLRKEIDSLLSFSSERGLHISMSPPLAALLRGEQQEAATYAPGRTRMCLQPWDRIFVGANGEVFPCCVNVEKVGHIDDVWTLGEAESVREWRHRMLMGDLPSICTGCSHGELCEPSELRAAVAKRLLESGRGRLVER